MTLGIDATLRYYLRDQTHPITASQLRLDTPYNTTCTAACRRRRSTTPGSSR